MAILIALNKRNGATVSEIAIDVGLSRGTVFRMLETLILDELVSKHPTENTYWLTSGVQALSGGYFESGWIIGVVWPALQALAAEIVWPVSVQRFEHGTMRVRASTDSQSPFAFWQSTAGFRIPFFESAGGRLYLAFATPRQRHAILSVVQGLEDPRASPGALAEPPPTKDQRARIRADGYSVTRKIVDSTVAVPIFVNGALFACLTTRFLNRGITQRRFMSQFEGILKQTAEEIGEALTAYGAISASPQNRMYERSFPTSRGGTVHMMNDSK